ncbi:MAG: FtsX-like permease family protein [Polyangia bacterium]|jgi:putative ABC transport system permease protein
MLFKIAFRNIFRNKRRSLMTLLAVGVGAVAIILFGEFVGFITAAMETGAARTVGHLTVYRSGYFDYGAGNPAAFGIADYQGVIRLISEDPEIKPKLNVITPTVSLAGIAGNFEIGASKTFFGTGFVPSDRDRMLRWDERDIFRYFKHNPSTMRDDDETTGVVGVGLARILGLCEKLGLTDCPPRPQLPTAANDSEPEAPDIAALAQAEREAAGAHASGEPRLDLLAATASGAPNVMSLLISGAERQGARELDDNFVAMHFSLAQKLLYGRGEHKAVAIVIQLHHTKDLSAVRARLHTLFAEHKLDLEVRDWIERQPFFKQAIDMFGSIFFFISVIMGVIVLFTVVNTMGMSVMERTNEIGTVRALGVRRGGIRRLFVIEGSLLGAFGATFGVVVGQTLAVLFNRTGMTWMPPGNSVRVPLQVLTTGVAPLLICVWLGLVLAASVAALVPANRAARFKVVDALRHV